MDEASGMLDKAAEAAADKALQMATGYIGSQAGEAAGEAVERYAPAIKRELVRGARALFRRPKAALTVAALAAAGLAAYWILQSRNGNPRRR